MLREAGVPYAFMTNGGGVTEAKKARELAELLDDPSIDESRVLLSHTPMRALADGFRGRRVVIVGGLSTAEVARDYGFEFDSGMAVTPWQIATGTPHIHPGPFRCQEGLSGVDVNDGIPIEAILIFFDPDDWHMELQVLTDVLAGGVPLGIGRPGMPQVPQAVEVFASNPDFLWQALYPVPRYGQAGFVECLRALWHRRSGQELRVTEFGKPHRSQFEAARGLIEAPSRCSACTW